MGQSGVRDSFLWEEGEIQCLDLDHASQRRHSLVADVAQSPALQIPEPGKLRQRGQAGIADEWLVQLLHRLTGPKAQGSQSGEMGQKADEPLLCAPRIEQREPPEPAQPAQAREQPIVETGDR